ncbi:MAG: 4a-hydroxytetrahydrobiopterin dehydratase [Acidobacteriota bacterium]|nr:4a-hydroxytetrahydrobiopterin dehydratase [Acidobacteriota bacterium]
MASRLLSPSELQGLLEDLPEWSIREGALVREWTLPGFPEAMLFVNRVAALAERANHHPDIDIRYSRVLLSLVSHDSGGITARDAAMARELGTVATGTPPRGPDPGTNSGGMVS